jgi:hypothetical protein
MDVAIVTSFAPGKLTGFKVRRSFRHAMAEAQVAARRATNAQVFPGRGAPNRRLERTVSPADAFAVASTVSAALAARYRYLWMAAAYGYF